MVDTAHMGGPSDEGPLEVTAPPDGQEGQELRHRRGMEHLGMWLFIGSDAVVLMLELFTWFYLRFLNTNGMWRGTLCSTTKPCIDGLGNPLTHAVPTASPWYSIIVLALTAIAVLLVYLVELSSRDQRNRSVIGGLAGLSFFFLLAAIAMSFYQFQHFPFTTVDGAYASAYEFFVGSSLAHIIILAIVGLGLWNRARKGAYDDGRWYPVRLIRIFAVWVEFTVLVLAFFSTFFS